MFNLYLKSIAFTKLSPNCEQEEFASLCAQFPKKKIRRMSKLGILVTQVLKDLCITNQPLVYATQYTESRALEKYLDSFPDASPTQFQTSIHPGGVEQALIYYQQPVSELIPLAGGVNLVPIVCQQLFISSSNEILLVGGEESGTWLREFGIAASYSFAFAALFSQSSKNAHLKLTLNSQDSGNATGIPNLFQFAEFLDQEIPFTLSHPAFGCIQLSYTR